MVERKDGKHGVVAGHLHSRNAVTRGCGKIFLNKHNPFGLSCCPGCKDNRDRVIRFNKLCLKCVPARVSWFNEFIKIILFLCSAVNAYQDDFFNT